MHQAHWHTTAVSEASTQRDIITTLNYLGWVVIETSQRMRVERGMVGLPDLIAMKDGNVILIECKAPRGKLRPAQIEFYERVKPHLTTTLRYVVARSVDDVIEALR